MYPVLLEVGGFKIRSYGVLVTLGFLVSYWLTYLDGKRKGYDKKLLSNLPFFIMIAGILGARLLYVIINLPLFIEDPFRVVEIWKGGLVYYGGLISGTLFGLWYLWRHKLNPWGFCDLAAPYIALGYAIGRIGCFLRGCCYGISIPIQIYSSIALLIIFVILMRIKAHKEFDGEVFSWYIILYSMGRFFLEFFRADPRGHIILDYISTSQAISLIGIPLGVFLMMKLREVKD